LQQWHDHLDPARVMQLFHVNLKQATAAPVEEQLRIWVHGKRFFREHVHGIIGKLTQAPSVPVETALANLQAKMTLPADLQPVWSAIGLP
jgi:hypothetical protein